MSTNKRLPVMEDYIKMHYVGDPYCNYDSLAWTASYWDLEAPLHSRRFREEVRMAEIKGSRIANERIITAGGKQERSPVIISNGAVLFLSDASLDSPVPEHGEIPQYIENELYYQMQLYRWENGNAIKLTSMLHGINIFSLSPDEKKVFFTSFKYVNDQDDSMTKERTKEERAAALDERLDKPFATENQRYKADAEMGYRSERTETLWVLNDGDLKCLISGESDFLYPCWMPDSRSILFLRPDENDKLEICSADIVTGEVVLIASVNNVSPNYEENQTPIVDLANQQIIFGGNVPDEEFSYPRGLYAVPLEGGQDIAARRLISPEKDTDGIFPQDMNFSSRGFHEDEYILMPDGYVYYSTGYEGDARIARISSAANEAPPDMVTGGMANYHSFRHYDDDHLLALVGLPERMPELALVDIHSGETTILTDSNPWMDEVSLQRPISVWTESGTQGFYIPPVQGEEPAPAILRCHGGPTGFFCSGLNYEFQALSAAGFGVLYANPRGGTGYGHERSKDKYAYDGTALSDLLEFVDKVCMEHCEIDPDRIGIAGGSYGGFLTLHSVSRSDRFKAASAHRALANMQMISASSHSAGGHTREEFPSYLELIKEGIKSSPSSYIDKIHIPLQILQSSLDANCVPEQANQVYTAMREWNPDIPCEYILYPDSCHGLEYKGPMELAIHHRNACLRWFREYL